MTAQIIQFRRPSKPQTPPDDPALSLMRRLAPGADDARLMGILDRVAIAWQRAWAEHDRRVVEEPAIPPRRRRKPKPAA